MFPETYFVAVLEYQPKFLLERLLGEFRKRVIAPYDNDIRTSHRTLGQIVTMASLVEEESRHGDERAVVAGILWKRFDAKMALDVDATVRYVLGKREALKESDLAINSAYNPRRFVGLPPGPIANPSESSIVAALHPHASDYWYYLHDAQGNIHYARTNEEHNENRARYLR